jgi:hypothetical protein
VSVLKGCVSYRLPFFAWLGPWESGMPGIRNQSIIRMITKKRLGNELHSPNHANGKRQQTREGGEVGGVGVGGGWGAKR